MMAVKTLLVGTLVAIHERAYDSFKADDGRTIAGGTVRTAFVVTSPSEQPVQVRVSDDHASAYYALVGSAVVIDCVPSQVQRGVVHYRSAGPIDKAPALAKTS